MILDRLENAEKYRELFPGIYEVLSFAKSVNPSDFPHDREYLKGNEIFANFAQYETNPASGGKLEAHRAYIDVMCMIAGKEIIRVKNTKFLSQILSEYNAEGDYLLARLDDDCSSILLQEGDFCILFPEDAHAPALSAETVSSVKKVIGKVAVK